MVDGRRAARREELTVCRTANLHTGGTIHDVTAELHPLLAEACVAASRALAIPVTGIDLLVTAPDQPGYVIIEANETARTGQSRAATDRRAVHGPALPDHRLAVADPLSPPGSRYGSGMSPLEIDLDFLRLVLVELLDIPSPTRRTDHVQQYVGERLDQLEVPFIVTRRGAIVADLGGPTEVEASRAVVVHTDTIGAMVPQPQEQRPPGTQAGRSPLGPLLRGAGVGVPR